MIMLTYTFVSAPHILAIIAFVLALLAILKPAPTFIPVAVLIIAIALLCA